MGIKMRIYIIGLFIVGFLQATQAQEYVAHDVKPGENVASIAKAYNVSANSILQLNPDVQSGQEISIPKLIIPVKRVPDNATKVDFTLYKVSPKETLYSISRSFGISVEDVKAFNPFLYERGLDMNDELRIPVTKLSEKEEEHITNNFNQSVTNSSFSKLKHLVLPKETKYSISKKYGISIAALDSLNPGIETLQAGQFVNINRNSSSKNEAKNPSYQLKTEELTYYVVPKKETIGSLLSSNEFTKERLEALNPALKYGGLSEGMVLKLPTKRKSLLLPGESFINLENFIPEKLNAPIYLTALLPLNLRAFQNDSIDKELLLKRSGLTQIAIDFYTGVKMAVDSAKTKGIPVQLNLLDIEKDNAYKIKSLFNYNSLPPTDAYIGPLLEEEIALVLKEIENKETLLFSPLVSPDYFHKNLVKTIPRNDLKQEVLITYLDKHMTPDVHLVSVTDASGYAIREKLKYSFYNVRFIGQENKNYVNKSDIKAQLSRDKLNWFLLETTDFGKIESTIAALIALQKEGYRIRLFTSNRSNLYEDEISNDYLSKLNFTFVAASKELVKPANPYFENHYKNLFGYYPTKYAVRGFDVAYDLILRLAYAQKEFRETLNFETHTEYFESKFNYQAYDFEPGYYNASLYLVEYLENLETQVIE